MQNTTKNAKWTGAFIAIWRFIVSFHPGTPCKSVYYTSLRARGPCPLRKGWCLDALAWPTLKNLSSSEALGDNELLDTWPLDFGRSVCRRDTPGSSSNSLSQTSSDNRLGGQKPCCIGWWTHDRLRNEYSVRLIMRMEQVITQWHAILFQLFCGSIFYRPVTCLFLYTKITL